MTPLRLGKASDSNITVRNMTTQISNSVKPRRRADFCISAIVAE